MKHIKLGSMMALLICMLSAKSKGLIVIQNPIGRIVAPYCSINEYGIAKTAYVDNNDGIDVKLELLRGDLTLPRYYDMVSFDAASRKLFVVPALPNDESDLREEKYVMRVTSSSHSRHDNFTVDYIQRPATPSILFKLGVSLNRTHYTVMTSKAQYHFMAKLSRFMNDTKYSLFMYSVDFYPLTSPSLTIQNCSFDLTRCPAGDIAYFKGAITSANGIKSEINRAMAPEFRVTQYSEIRTANCASNTKPQFDPLSELSENLLKTVDAVVYNGTWVVPEILIPNTIVWDEEDGNVKDLLVTILDKNRVVTSPEFWIHIRNGHIRGESKYIVVVFTEATWLYGCEEVVDSSCTTSAFLRFTDSNNNGVRVALSFRLTPSPPANTYTVQFAMTVFSVRAVAQAMQVQLFMRRLHAVLKGDYAYLIFVRSYEITSVSNDGASAQGTVVWSLAQDECDFNRVNYIRRTLFSPGTSKLLTSTEKVFADSSSSDVAFQINTATESVLGKCVIEPPVITRPLPKLSISFCGLFEFQIPEDTFIDNQDGNSRNLQIALIDNSGREADSTSWLYFDKQTQKLFGLLKRSQDTETLDRFPLYKLRVTDSSNQSITVDLDLEIVGKSLPPPFHVVLLLEKSSASTNIAMHVATTVGTFFGDGGSGFQLVDHSMNQNEEIVVFSNCTWRTDPCDAVNLYNYKLKIMTGAKLSPGFLEIFENTLPKVRGSFSTQKPCSSDESPKSGNAWGPLQLETCSNYLAAVPADVFIDKEQGDARNLRLELKTSAGLDIATDSWLIFDTSLQTISAIANVATTDASFSLVATDLAGNVWQQSVEVKIVKPSNAPSHTVVMRLRQLGASFKTYVEIYSAVRKYFQAFFGDSESASTFRYLSMTGVTSSLAQTDLTVTWENCTLSRSVCESDKVAYISRLLITSGQVNPALNSHLSKDFLVSSIQVSRSGICEAVRNAPKLNMSIPEQTMSICGYLEYPIPAHTFDDSIDGNTRYLTLSLTTSDGKALSRGSWISLNTTLQTIYAVLAHLDADSVQSPTRFQFLLVATNKRGLSSSTAFTIRLLGSRKNISYIFQMNFRWNGDASLPNPYVYQVLLKKLAGYYGQGSSEIYNYNLERTSDGRYITFQFISCSFVFEPCDFAYIKRFSELTTVRGRITDALFNLLLPDFKANDFQGQAIASPCRPPTKPPRLVNSLDPITVSKCSAFRIRFRKDSFIDEEDGTNLIYLVTEINGLPVDKDSSWIQVFDATHEFYGVLTHRISPNHNHEVFTINIRAFDTEGNSANATLVASDTDDRTLQTFYQFRTRIQILQPGLEDLYVRYEVARKINVYLNHDDVNIVHYRRPETRETVEIDWAPCSLPDQCSPEAIRLYTEKIILPSSAVLASFNSIFAPNFQLQSIALLVDPVCLTPLHPPIPKSNVLMFTVASCGYFEMKLTADIFYDIEDGDAKNLKLSLAYGGTQATDRYGFLRLDQNLMIISGFVTRLEAIDFNDRSVNLTLVAKDKTGLAGTASLIIRFNIPAQPRYRFVFDFSLTEPLDLPSKAYLFTKKLASYQGQTSTDNIELIEMTSNRLIYANCSINYNPCDWAALERLRSSYSIKAGVPTTELARALSPEFSIEFVNVEYEEPCKETAAQPPKVMNPISKVLLKLCSNFSMQIPRNTFYDYEDGDTMQLTLTVAVKAGYSFRHSSWMKFDEQQKIATVIAFAQSMATQPVGGFVFALTATDSTRLSASTDLRIEMQGPYSILLECQVQITLETSAEHSTSSDFQLVELIVVRLAKYLALPFHEIGLVSLTRSSSMQVMFAFSYCSSIYGQEKYLSNGLELEVDYEGLITRMLMKIYQSDRKTVQAAFRGAFASFNFVKVVTQFTGRCANLPPIVPPGIPDFNMVIGFGGYQVSKYEFNVFFDFESGWAYDLTLDVVDSTGQSVFISSWINVETKTTSIYAVSTDDVRNSRSASFIFYLRARDVGGKNATIKILVTKNDEILNFPPFNTTFHLTYLPTALATWAYQSSFLINSISRYFSGLAIRYIMVRWYLWTGTSTFIMKWTVANEDCQSKVFEDIRNMSDAFGNIQPKLQQSIIDMFLILRRTIQTSCDQHLDPPIIIRPIPDLAIQFCSIFTYKIAPFIIFDKADGDMKNLEVRLMSPSSQEVTKESWIQVDPGKLQIYAIAYRSVLRRQRSFSFQIHAANRAGKAVSLPFKVNLEDVPFTSDCPMTMQFRFKFSTASVLDLDVLWRVVTAISAYYGDENVKIKVLDFARVHDEYTIVWSNCSFSFSTLEEARFGLDESDRTRIKEIFSKVLTESGAISTKFALFMSTLIEINSLKASYCCIEQAPEPAQGELKVRAFFCTGFREQIPASTFYDECDGDTRQLMLTLYTVDKEEVGLKNWVQLNKATQTLFGVVTDEVREREPGDGYKFILSATDYSGRSSTVTYTIMIIDSPKNFAAYFETGFISNHDPQSPTAVSLYDFREKLATYLAGELGGPGVYIAAFFYPSRVRWSHCDLHPTCTADKVLQILSRLQLSVFAKTPNPLFVTAMRPNVVPYYTQVAMTGRCIAKSNTTIIVVPPVPRPELPSCGDFSFKIPENLFIDGQGGDASNFLLSMSHKNGTEFHRSSWIQFDPTKQLVYGVSVLSKISERASFILRANQYESGSVGALSLDISFPDHEVLQNILPSLCLLRMTVKSNYSTAWADVELIRLFLGFISQFLAASASEIQIVDYSRNDQYPETWSITWTNCSLAFSLSQSNNAQAYFDDASVILQQFFSDITEQVIRQQFFDFLQENSLFAIMSIETLGSCSKPPERPPTATQIDPIEISRCGVSTSEIPSNAFIDDRDGNARKLKLSLTSANGEPLRKDTWIYLSSDQKIVAFPTNSTLTEYPSDGYKFLLAAEDSSGLTATQSLRVKFKELVKPYYDTPIVYIDLSVITSLTFQFEVEKRALIARKLESYPLLETIDYIPAVEAGTGLGSYVVLNCAGYCDAKPNIFLRETVEVEFEDLLQHFLPQFTLIRSDYSVRGECSSNDKVLDKFTPILKTASYCSIFQYDLEAEYGAFPGIGMIFSLDSNFLSNLPTDSWKWYDNKTNKIYAYPKDSYWNEPAYNSSLAYYKFFDLRTKSPIGLPHQLSLLLLPISKGDTPLKYQTIVAVARAGNEYDAYFIREALIGIQKALGNNQTIAFSDFSWLPGESRRFQITWKICLENTSCDSLHVKRINKIIATDRGVPTKTLIDSLPDGLKVESLESRCLNNAPTPLAAVLNITITLCGLFRYTFNSSIIYDQEEGSLLNRSVLLWQGEPVTMSSWIMLDQGQLLGYPTELVAKNPAKGGLPYVLQASDNEGKVARVHLNVFLEDYTKSFLSVDATLENLESSRPYVMLQDAFFKTIVFVSMDPSIQTSNFRVITFQPISGTQSTYQLTYGDCTVQRKVCGKQKEKLARLKARLLTDTGTVQDLFKFAAKINRINIISLRYEEQFIEDKPPEVRRKLNPIALSKCDATKVCLYDEKGFFIVDAEDIDPNSLDLTLVTSDGGRVGNEHWVRIMDWCVYVVPRRQTQIGTHEFVIRATDTCNNTSEMPLTIALVDSDPAGFKMQLNMSNPSHLSSPDSVYIFNISATLRNYLQVEGSNVSIESYAPGSDQTLITFGICSIQETTCIRKELDRLSLLIFEGNSPNPNLINAFKPSLIVYGVAETLPQACLKETIKTGEPIVLNASYCQELNYEIPNTSFYDLNEGNARNLRIQLLYENMTIVDRLNWMQLNASSRVIYGYPRVHLSKAVDKEFRYILTAKNSKGSTGYLPLLVRVHGDIPTVTYAITVSGNLRSFRDPDVSSEIQIMSILARALNRSALVNIGLQRDAVYPYLVEFTWSFCRMRSQPCDCMFIKKTEQELHQHRSSIDKALDSEIKVDKFASTVFGTCQETNNPQVLNSLSTVNIKPGETFGVHVPDNAFFDVEDGGTSNMTLSLISGEGNALVGSFWLQVISAQICGVIPLETYRKNYNRTKRIEFVLVVTDNCGKKASDRFAILPDSAGLILNYKLCMELENLYEEVVRCNTTQMLIDKIKSYIGHPLGDVVIETLEEISTGRAMATRLCWGPKNVAPTNCSDNSLKPLRSKFIQKTGALNQSFVDALKPEFDLLTASDNTCDLPKSIETPWDIVTPIVAVFGVLIILWILWIIVPRICPKFCKQNCICCRPCCEASGRCSSVKEARSSKDSDEKSAPFDEPVSPGDTFPSEPTFIESPRGWKFNEKNTQTGSSLATSSSSASKLSTDESSSDSSVDSGLNSPPPFLVPPLYRPEWYYDGLYQRHLQVHGHHERHRGSTVSRSRHTIDDTDGRQVHKTTTSPIRTDHIQVQSWIDDRQSVLSRRASESKERYEDDYVADYADSTTVVRHHRNRGGGDQLQSPQPTNVSLADVSHQTHGDDPYSHLGYGRGMPQSLDDYYTREDRDSDKLTIRVSKKGLRKLIGRSAQLSRTRSNEKRRIFLLKNDTTTDASSSDTSSSRSVYATVTSVRGRSHSRDKGDALPQGAYMKRSRSLESMEWRDRSSRAAMQADHVPRGRTEVLSRSSERNASRNVVKYGTKSRKYYTDDSLA